MPCPTFVEQTPSCCFAAPPPSSGPPILPLLFARMSVAAGTLSAKVPLTNIFPRASRRVFRGTAERFSFSRATYYSTVGRPGVRTPKRRYGAREGFYCGSCTPERRHGVREGFYIVVRTPERRHGVRAVIQTVVRTPKRRHGAREGFCIGVRTPKRRYGVRKEIRVGRYKPSKSFCVVNMLLAISSRCGRG